MRAYQKYGSTRTKQYTNKSSFIKKIHTILSCRLSLPPKIFNKINNISHMNSYIQSIMKTFRSHKERGFNIDEYYLSCVVLLIKLSLKTMGCMINDRVCVELGHLYLINAL